MLLVLNKAVVHFVQRYETSRISILPTRRERRSNPELEQRIEESWARRLSEAPGGSLWDGKVARLVAHGALPDRLALYLGETTYREFVGTNLESSELHETLGDDFFANPLGVSAAVVSRDGAVLLARRSNRVSEERGQWDLPGGNIEIVDGATPDPLRSILSELEEEIQLRREDIEDITCVALVENGFTHKPDLVFLCQARERAKVLLKQARQSKSVEHDDFLCIPTPKEDLVEFMRRRADDLTPVAAGGLAVFVS